MKATVVLLILAVTVMFVISLPSEGFGTVDVVLGGLLVLAFLFGPLAIIYLVGAFLKADSR